MEKEKPPLLQIPEDPIGKDELNLIELPFALLSTRNPNVIAEQTQTWTSKGKDGSIRQFHKRVIGDPKLGLPTARAEELYITLMKITRDQSFRNREVHTTKYQILQTARWPDKGSNYSRLKSLLDQLVAVTIYSNAFWDTTTQDYREKAIGIIDEYDFPTTERRGKKSLKNPYSPTGFFRWNETLFDSFISGNLKSLDLDVYFDLHSYTAKRLYRYTDKHLHLGTPFAIDIKLFAGIKLGMSESLFRYPSKIIEKLTPAIEELRQKNLADVQIEKSQTDSGYKLVISPASKTVVTVNEARDAEIETNAEYRQHLADLTSRGVSKRQASRLVRDHNDWIKRGIELWELEKKKNPDGMKNPAGYLVSIIKAGEDWQPPDNYISPEEKNQRQEKKRRDDLVEELVSLTDDNTPPSPLLTKSEKDPTIEELNQEVVSIKAEKEKRKQEEKARIEQVLEGLSEEEREDIREEVLSSVDGFLHSSQTFKELSRQDIRDWQGSGPVVSPLICRRDEIIRERYLGKGD